MGASRGALETNITPLIEAAVQSACDWEGRSKNIIINGMIDETGVSFLSPCRLLKAMWPMIKFLR